MTMIFITDRNLLDVSQAKELSSKILTAGYDSLTESEKAQWESALKGFLNHTDLNRIEGNIQEVADTLEISVDVGKTDWVMNSLPTLSDFQRIRDNTQKIRSSGYARKDTPLTPVLPLNTYGKINDIEKILLDVFSLYEQTRDSVIYIDEIYIDESIGDL